MKTSKIQIGDFLEITAWKALGQVIAIGPATYGDDSALRIVLEEDPDGKLTHEYQLEDGQFINHLQ